MLKTTTMDGSSVADELLEEIEGTIQQENIEPRLDVVLVGEDESSLSYIRQKRKSAEQVGIATTLHTFERDVSPDMLRQAIGELNSVPAVDGIIVQLPLPDGLNDVDVLSMVDPDKDVDGLHPLNFGRLLGGDRPKFYPPTPRGILHLLSHYDVRLTGINAVMVGMGRLVGRPLSQMLLNRDATVMCLNDETENLREFTRQGELLIAGAGVPELLTNDHVKEGAVVIDAGINQTENGLVGDVDFESAAEAARLITPVPGGVGPLTVACLLENTLESHLG